MKLVKRLIGLPGDTLEMREKALFINGESKDEPYAEYIDGSPGLTDPIMLWQRDQRKLFMTPNIMSWRPNMEKNGLLKTKSLTKGWRNYAKSMEPHPTSSTSCGTTPG